MPASDYAAGRFWSYEKIKETKPNPTNICLSVTWNFPTKAAMSLWGTLCNKATPPIHCPKASKSSFSSCTCTCDCAQTYSPAVPKDVPMPWMWLSLLLSCYKVPGTILACTNHIFPCNPRQRLRAGTIPRPMGTFCRWETTLWMWVTPDQTFPGTLTSREVTSNKILIAQ